MNRAFRVFGLWGAAALVVGIAVGCSNNEDLGESDDELHSSLRTKDNLLTDAELLGQSGTIVPDAQQIQKFLEKTSHTGQPRSVLADKKVLIDDGSEVPREMLVSEAIYQAARAGGINPLELLVRLQQEQGLVSKTASQITPAQLDAKLKQAMGCGCPHAPICKTHPGDYTGFYQQISCAVRVIKLHMDDAKSKGRTYTGWGRGVTKRTEDGASITPETNATAVLYTYTPYAGQDFEGERSSACKTNGQNDYCSGAALHTWLWDSYATAISGTTPARDAGSDGNTNTRPVPTTPPTPTTPPSPTTPPYVPPYEPPVPGECSSDYQCASNYKGGACLTDYTCGCYSDSDCTVSQQCDLSVKRCRAIPTPVPTPTPTPSPTYTPPYTPPSGGYTPPESGFPLYDAGAAPIDPAAATPPATAPRAVDDPSLRPTPGADPSGGVGYSTNNPYGDGTSTADAGAKKKKNAATDSGGCTIASPGGPSDLSSSFFLVAGVASLLAGRRRKRDEE